MLKDCDRGILWEHWFQAYGIPGEIIADNDVRWGQAQGWWRTLMRAYKVRFTTTVPYKSRTNGVVERRNRELPQILRMLSQQQNSSNWVKTLPLAVCILNEQSIGKSGKNPAELFQNRVSWHAVQIQPDKEGNPAATNWIMEDRKAQKTVREYLLNNCTRQLPKRATRPIEVHDWVLVHHRHFPGH